MTKEYEQPNGDRLRIVTSGAETGGERLEMEAFYRPHSTKPPLHYHPFQEEAFEVLEGAFRVRVGHKEQTYGPGDTFIVPTSTPHWMHNVSGETGRLRWHVRPALKTEHFFATMWGLAADGKVNENGVPNLLRLAVILREFRDEFRASSPPYWLQCILFGLLAPLGRLVGYESHYQANTDRGDSR